MASLHYASCIEMQDVTMASATIDEADSAWTSLGAEQQNHFKSTLHAFWIALHR